MPFHVPKIHYSYFFVIRIVKTIKFKDVIFKTIQLIKRLVKIKLYYKHLQ